MTHFTKEQIRNYFDTVTAIITAGLLAGYFLVPFFDKVTWYQMMQVCIAIGIIPRTLETLEALWDKKFGVDVIALAAIVSSFFTGDIVAGAVVLLMLFSGAFLERYAGERARISLSRLLAQAPTVASVYRNEILTIVPVDEVAVGDIVFIKQGEVLPLDGIVHKGESSVDESMVTGESVFRDVTVDDRVISGSINQGETFTMRVTAIYADSVFRGIVKLVEKAELEKAPMVRMADRYSMYFTLFTVSLATAAFIKDPRLVTAVLVAATPCPLILAAPIAFIAGMSKSARNGVIVKHGGVFESLQKVKAFFFDKTGTLTLGAPSVLAVRSFDDTYTKEMILQIAASLEQSSSHILAESIVMYAAHASCTLLTPENVTEETSKGITGMLNGKRFFVGSISFLESHNIVLSEVVKNDNLSSQSSKVYVACNQDIIGSISFSETVRKNATHVLKELRSLYHDIHFVLLTGDKKERAQMMGKQLGLHDVVSECLPETKLALVEEYEEKGNHVVMVGDGVNDAPALAKATVGIALSSHGGTSATDIADVVIMVDDLEKIVTLVKISKHTTRVAKQSMFFGIGLSVIAMLFAFGGYLPPAEGAVLQEGIDVLMILNALRAL